MSTQSQCNSILAYLNKGYPLTPRQAQNYWECDRLAARIKDLRNMGYVILTEMVKKNGKRFARYHMVRGDRK